MCRYVCTMVVSSIFFHCPSLSIHSKFSTLTLWSALLDGLLFLQLFSLLSAGVSCCAPIPFSQVIAQGILIKVNICCCKVTFQTSCDFNGKKSELTPSLVINTLLKMKYTFKGTLFILISFFISLKALAFCQPQSVYLIPFLLHTVSLHT